MIDITLTPAQAEKVARDHNVHSKAQISAGQAGLVFHDNAETEMENNGYFVYEISRHESKTGLPVELKVCAEDVTIQEIEV